MAGAGGQYAGYSSDGGKASDEEGPGDPRWFGIAMAAGYLEIQKDRQHKEKRQKTLKVHAEGKENLEVGGEARDHGGVAAGSDAGGARAAGGVGAGNDGGGARAAAPAPVSLKVCAAGKEKLEGGGEGGDRGGVGAGSDAGGARAAAPAPARAPARQQLLSAFFQARCCDDDKAQGQGRGAEHDGAGGVGAASEAGGAGAAAPAPVRVPAHQQDPVPEVGGDGVEVLPAPSRRFKRRSAVHSGAVWEHHDSDPSPERAPRIATSERAKNATSGRAKKTVSRLLKGNVEGLKRELKNRGVRGYSRMKKAELRELLERTLQAEAEVDNKQMQIEEAGLSEDKAAKESSLGQPNRRDSVRGETYDSQMTTASLSGDDSEDKAAKESSLGQPNRRDSVRAPARAAFHVSQALGETYDSQMTTASLSGDDSEDKAEEALYRESDRRAGCGAANNARSRRGRG